MNSEVVRYVGILGAFAAVYACACGNSEAGRPDDQLGELVIAPDNEPPIINVDKAAGDPTALLGALSTPHRRVYEVLGPHTFKGTSSIEVSEGGKVIETLSDTTEIAIDEKGNYRAVLDNSRDYGRHVIFFGGTMYLRPRFGKYHKRPPTDEDEPARVRDEMFATLGAYYEPLATRAELTDAGSTSAGKRPARLIKIKSAPSVRDAPAQTLEHKKWRETAVAESVSGQVVLDAESGVPLEANLSGTLKFARKGRSFSMKLQVTHEITLGAPPAIAAPPEDQTIETYVRLKELDDRETLLEGIAPPAKKPPTPDNTTGSGK